ncbi:hypothetical protein PMIN03_009738 [Paraphaeosphaeria minitans]
MLGRGRCWTVLVWVVLASAPFLGLGGRVDPAWSGMGIYVFLDDFCSVSSSLSVGAARSTATTLRPRSKDEGRVSERCYHASERNFALLGVFQVMTEMLLGKVARQEYTLEMQL